MKLILGILLAAAVAVALFQQSQISRLKRTVADLNAQVQQAATDGAADQVLEVQLKELRDREANNRRELARLRGQVSKNSQLEKDNAALTADKNRLAGQIAQLSQQTAAQPAPAQPAPQEVADFGEVEFSEGAPLQFDLGDGKECTITANLLPDGNLQLLLGGNTLVDGVPVMTQQKLVAGPGTRISTIFNGVELSFVAQFKAP